ncbi:MAG: aspartyl/asparaginyl beta-hydroxylase domain-containing protein [Alphaproteobacteria bacterium]|nr:aspartyl/asparaginyl beta-hydroxylase domain-containing protein [Alphaproteobacteria bacterium]MBL6937926.1 aspartyl/asparaginyl beta-hydroxylase domain-containing protein [Alphaproteobacteria bacterium]MBL7099249.1 aspartyl/asparaginyl beta-hydroxylase domain-containing protein [Alphaproteobacteria bacterium]
MATGQFPQVEALARQADQAMQTGRMDEAARLWGQVRQLAPRHPGALMFLGQHALHRGDTTGARLLLEQAAEADPNNPVIVLNLSAAYRATNDPRELLALDRALAIDPYFFPALLAKGMFFDRAGNAREAARVFRDVLTIAPAVPDDWMKQPLARARAVVDENIVAVTRFLDARLAEGRAKFAGADLRRFEEAKGIMTGAKKAFVQQPTLLNFPQLPPIQFYDRKDFPWLAEVEAATDTIREEFLALWREDAKEFAAYVNHPDGVPLNQWTELNRSPRWSVFFLWGNGVRNDAHCARVPKTAALLDKVPMATVPGAAPAAFFSTLQPRTLIPPHTGVTNTRLIVHIPLVVPPGCWFRVGNDTREWEPGTALIFDDTIEHEAWNGGDRMRAVLIFDIWNPYLTDAERAMTCELLAGYEAYYGPIST